MAIAYGGTAVSELFRRLKVTVLAEPLEYSAAFLPVLPVVGFWMLNSDLSYSTMLVVVGLLYLFLSLRRGSFVYSAAAADQRTLPLAAPRAICSWRSTPRQKTFTSGLPSKLSSK